MARSSIANSVKLRHSLSGKLDVVKGAMSDRLKLTEKFIRKSETVKSYGTLITLRYDPGSEGQRMFPNAIQDGAVPLERDYDTNMVKVVEWAIPKDGRRYHTWPFNETDLEIADIIVVSDEVPPPPWEDGKSYTLWTTAHQENNLVVNGRRLEVHQIPYVWSLAMSVKLDAHSNIIGSYETDDLSWFMWPEEKKKHKRRVKRRLLSYELVWNITEMQVKTFVRAIFPNPTGPLTMQLAEEQPLGPQELIYGESQSQALVKDIQVSAREAAHAVPVARPRQLTENGRTREQTVEQDQRLDDILSSSGRRLVNNLANEYQQPRAEVAQMTDHVQTARPVAQMTSDRQIPPPARTTEPIPGPSRSAPRDGPGRLGETTEIMPWSPLQPPQTSSSNLKTDGRRRDGCYTCKLRKKKCDCSYTFIGTTNSQTCHTCSRHGITCHTTEPEWVNDPDRVRAHLDEQKRLLKLKRKSRDDSVSSGRASRDRSATVRPTEFSMHQNSVLHSIENGFLDHHPGSINGPSASPSKGMAIRGGKGGFKRPRQ
ncbi:hypothetical protein BDZ45DRAFT_150850 [Acephala macrosclerotiorum]|nr:hypothetical protein BDZ45DRAFT_150850 [Acephala macrosclerotiorum]